MYEETRFSIMSTDYFELNMKSTLIISSLILHFSMIFVGFLLNGFIFTTNVIGWFQGKPLQAIDLIMASLGLVRILLLMYCVLTSSVLISVELYNLFKIHLDYIFLTWVFVELCSLWWGTVLCVFYCVKISNYNSRLFVKLKMRISRMVPWLLLGSLMVSLLSSLPHFWFVYSLHEVNFNQSYNGMQSGNVNLSITFANLYILNIIGTFVPFLIFCLATFFLVVPLYKHTRNMNSNNTGLTKGHLEVHLSAIRNMLSFLIFYILCFISGNLLPLGVQLQNPFFILICLIFLAVYPSLHSVVLIISNVKLKQSVIDVLHCSKRSNFN